MLHIAICDDDISILPFLSKAIDRILNKAGYECKLYFYSSGERLLTELLQKYISIDIVFLDINLVSANGIDIALQITELSSSTMIVFISGEKEYITDSFVAEPLSYLLKPIREEKLELAIYSCLRNIEEPKSQKDKSFIIIKSGSETKKIEFKDVECVESQKRLCLFHLSKGIEKTYARLDEIAVKLPDYFLRAHKSYMVNMNKIDSFRQREIYLSSGLIVPVPRNNIALIKNAYLEYHQKNRVLGK